MNVKSTNSNTDINYLDVVLNGYSNTNNREFLEKYFYREFKKAEKELLYEADEFFKGCLSIAGAFYTSLEYELFKRKDELYFMQNRAENKTSNFAPDNRNISYEERCLETIEYCTNELKEIGLNFSSIQLHSITKGKFTGHLYYDDVLFIESKIIEAYQKIINEISSIKKTVFNLDDIDFSNISPEYYENKAKELDAANRINFVINRDFIERSGVAAKGIEIGDIGTRLPDWYKSPSQAFKLFEDYYATSWLLTEVAGFLEKVYEWNEKAIKEKLNELNEFANEAEKISLAKAYKDVAGDFSEMQKRIYLRLKHGSYYKQKSIEYDNTFHSAKIIYGKYFLFKDLLDSKINVELNVSETDNSNKGNEENPKSEIDAGFMELKELVKYYRNDANWHKLQTALDTCKVNIKNENFKKIQFAALFSIIYHLENDEGVKIFRDDSNFKKVKSLLDIILNADSGSYKESKLSKAKNKLTFKYRWINLL